MQSRAARTAATAAAAGALLWATAGQAAATSLWPMYHLDPAHTGNDGGEPSFRNLGSAWTRTGLDGAVYAEPLVSGGAVIVATENDSVYAFDTGTGATRWSVHVGTPRTSNFPCGDIMPLGITGTPVIDGGSLFVLAEEQSSPTTFAFHLIRIDPSSGAVGYDQDVTPAGMDTNVHQERAALAVSNGNVVILWGGMSGDCGNYHGYIETVSETTGVPQAAWHDTSTGSKGGLWGASGAAVDGAGNIYVATGNGSSTSITNYDYGNSVLKFSPSLILQSFFAPGAPTNWASLSASDTDLGSVGPSLLANGLLFTIGKGGRGYLLNQAALPNNSNPGGGENHSAQVCHATSNAAFGGLAVLGNLLLVPCSDGIAGVSIDSASSFHVQWYAGHGGAPPIVAGGLIWTGAMLGGSTLFGLDPGGNLIAQLSLPATTEHFATPAAGDSRLFMAAGTTITAYVPPAPSPAPPAGGYVLDGWGGVHQYGGASAASATAYWPRWDIARGIAMRPDRASGFVLDGYGGVNPFGLATAVTGVAYWPGWDIARAIVLNPCDGSGNSGYTLDGWGGVHPFGGAPSLVSPSYWRGWDIARAIAVNPCTSGAVSGYILDGWGGVHPFWQQGSAAVNTPSGFGYWSGWDIARSIVIVAFGVGYTLDGWGGVHPFGGAPAHTATAYFAGQNIARSMSFSPSLGAGYVLDAYGGLHPWWIAGSAGIGVPSGDPSWGFQIARGVAQ